MAWIARLSPRLRRLLPGFEDLFRIEQQEAGIFGLAFVRAAAWQPFAGQARHPRTAYRANAQEAAAKPALQSQRRRVWQQLEGDALDHPQAQALFAVQRLQGGETARLIVIVHAGEPQLPQGGLSLQDIRC